MAMFQVILKGLYQAQMIINGLGFVSANDDPATATAIGLTRALGYVPTVPNAPATDTFLEAYLAAQTDAFQLQEIMVRNLFGATDFYTAALSGTGWAGDIVAGADADMSFVAQKLQTNRVNQDIGRGSLALTPTTEESTTPDGFLNAPSIARLQLVCDRLNEPPSFTEAGSVTDFIPTVFQKERRPVPDSNPVRHAYYFYDDPADQLAHAAVGVTWFPKDRVSSQVSRRWGKGA